MNITSVNAQPSVTRAISRDTSRDASRVFTEAEARRIVNEFLGYASNEGALNLTVSSHWQAGQRWARNEASMTSDQRDVDIRIIRRIRGGMGDIFTNQTDTASLKASMDIAEFYANLGAGNTPLDKALQRPTGEAEGAVVWSDATFNRAVEENGRVVHGLTERSRRESFLSAGYIGTLGSRALQYSRDVWGREDWRWGEVTQAQCSITVRHPLGIGSGWAGQSSFEINRVDLEGIAERAFDKCLKSLDPVRIEPGRYQTILEPQAVATFVEILVGSMSLQPPEQSAAGPYFLDEDRALRLYRSKLGLKIVDERINIYHDPTDPIVGTLPTPLVAPRYWVKDGVLMSLSSDFKSYVTDRMDPNPPLGRSSFRMDGGDVSQEEMIASTKRGLLVTRVTPPKVVDGQSLLSTGLTRDGLWLIENGKITKSVRNFRWTESPLFICNNVEQLGVAVPVFKPGAGRASRDQNALTSIVVPSMKVNDFSFTSTIEAI